MIASRVIFASWPPLHKHGLHVKLTLKSLTCLYNNPVLCHQVIACIGLLIIYVVRFVCLSCRKERILQRSSPRKVFWPSTAQEREKVKDLKIEDTCLPSKNRRMEGEENFEKFRASYSSYLISKKLQEEFLKRWPMWNPIPFEVDAPSHMLFRAYLAATERSRPACLTTMSLPEGWEDVPLPLALWKQLCERAEGDALNSDQHVPLIVQAAVSAAAATMQGNPSISCPQSTGNSPSDGILGGEGFPANSDGQSRHKRGASTASSTSLSSNGAASPYEDFATREAMAREMDEEKKSPRKKKAKRKKARISPSPEPRVRPATTTAASTASKSSVSHQSRSMSHKPQHSVPHQTTVSHHQQQHSVSHQSQPIVSHQSQQLSTVSHQSHTVPQQQPSTVSHRQHTVPHQLSNVSHQQNAVFHQNQAAQKAVSHHRATMSHQGDPMQRVSSSMTQQQQQQQYMSPRHAQVAQAQQIAREAEKTLYTEPHYPPSKPLGPMRSKPYRGNVLWEGRLMGSGATGTHKLKNGAIVPKELKALYEKGIPKMQDTAFGPICVPDGYAPRKFPVCEREEWNETMIVNFTFRQIRSFTSLGRLWNSTQLQSYIKFAPRGQEEVESLGMTLWGSYCVPIPLTGTHYNLTEISIQRATAFLNWAESVFDRNWCMVENLNDDCHDALGLLLISFYNVLHVLRCQARRDPAARIVISPLSRAGQAVYSQYRHLFFNNETERNSTLFGVQRPPYPDDSTQHTATVSPPCTAHTPSSTMSDVSVSLLDKLRAASISQPS